MTVEKRGAWGRNVQEFKIENLSDATLCGALDALGEEHYIASNGLLVPKRNKANVGWLNSVRCDVDFHGRDALSASELEIKILQFQIALVECCIPAPSIIVRSGQGFWPHWLLREPSSDRSVVASLATIEQWARISAALTQWCKDHGFPTVDCATSENRGALTRLPNSIHAATKTRVTYTINVGALYTLDEIEAAFPTAIQDQHQPEAHEYASYVEYEPETTHEQVTGRRRGWDALVAQRKLDFRQLIAMRGDRVRLGARHAHATILAMLLSGSPGRDATVGRFGANTCEPPMTVAEVLRALDHARKVRKMRDTTIGRKLKITPEENEWLAGDYLTPKPKRAAFKNQKQTREARRLRVKHFVAEHGTHSAREIAKALGYPRGSVMRDLAALSANRDPNTVSIGSTLQMQSDPLERETLSAAT